MSLRCPQCGAIGAVTRAGARCYCRKCRYLYPTLEEIEEGELELPELLELEDAGWDLSDMEDDRYFWDR